MASRPDTSDYLNLFLSDVPLMDVRAPVEFSKGVFPTPRTRRAGNTTVGICYKEKGEDKAIELGHQLVAGDVKARRIEAWKRFVARHPDGYLFCFRGGLRSRLTQQWIRDAGIDYPLVKGGYKALRRFLIDSLDQLIDSEDFRILSGRTGTGKTRLLMDLPNPVDLEGLANLGLQLRPASHRSRPDRFRNHLAVAMLKAHHQVGGPVYLEDESRLIGRCALPEHFRARMSESPLLILEQPMAERVDIIRTDYVEHMLADYIARDGEEAGWLNFRDYLLSAIDRIRKRLGGARHRNFAP